MSSELKERLKALAPQLGIDLIGFCRPDPPESLPQLDHWLKEGLHGTMDYMARHRDLRADPARLLPGVRSVVAIGVHYYQERPDQPGEPKVARYALGRDYHKVLRTKLNRLAEALPEAQSRPCVDTAPILEREYAHRAGLGWFGKNTCLIHTRQGSWFFIGILLTTAEIEPDRPMVGGCGSCTACIDACPTGAIVPLGSHWAVDGRRCISSLTIEHRGTISSEIAAKFEGWTYGCDICQEVCPFNHPRPHQPERAPHTREHDFAPRRFPSLVEMAEWSESDWDQTTRGSATRRASLAQWRRNARINLGKPTE